MEKIFKVMMAIIALFALPVKAQNLNRQTSINIEGTMFNISVNDSLKYFVIEDNAYMIDDRKYPIAYKKRGIKNFKDDKQPKVRTLTTGQKKEKPMRVLKLPQEVAINGDVYTFAAIGRAAFAGFTNIDKVVIPETVVSIGEYAFFRSSVSSIVIPGSVTSIGNRAFGYCEKLKDLVVPRNIEINDRLYAESKNVSVTFTNELQNTPAMEKRPEMAAIKPIMQTPSKPSDVDIEIPVVRSNNENTFAIIIANENYQNEVNVQFAKQDGRIFRDYCSKVLGLADENIRYRENATLNNINEDVDWMNKVGDAFDGQASFIFYYAGHGVPDESNGNAYLLPIDGTGTNIKTGYSLNNLYKKFGELSAEHVIVFLDACFSGSLRGDGMLASARGVAIKSASEAPQGNMVVFTAAQGDETAWPYDEMGHGMFTYFLLKKLKETKGNVTLNELGTYITQQVKRRSILSNGKQQTPTIKASTNLGDLWKNLKLK